MTLQVSFDCCLCEFNANSEEMINYHYLWSHEKWRGHCENPNQIDTETEANSIINNITHTLRKKWSGKIEEGTSTQLNYYELKECIGLLQRLDELDWAKPNILYSKRLLKSLQLLDEYEKRDEYQYNTLYTYSKEKAIKRRDSEDQLEEHEKSVKKLSLEIDEEMKREKEN